MDKDQFFDWPSKNMKVKTDLLFSGSAFELEEFLSIAEKCASLVNESLSLRLIVLETWLFIDYGIRQLLMSALGLSRFNHEEYDLRYNLLPRSFEGCLNLLLRLKKVNEGLEPNPEDNRITYPIRFTYFLMKEHEEFFDRLLEVEKEYYEKYYPSLVPQKRDDIYTLSISKNVLDTGGYRRISNTWLESVVRINEDWSKKATKLNGARNLAAHSYDEQKIAARMGYTDDHALKHVKEHCLELLEQLIGVVAKTKGDTANTNAE